MTTESMRVISLDELQKIDDRPARKIPVPSWGKDAAVVVREPDTATDTKIMRSCMEGEAGNQVLNNEDFAVKHILAGFVEPKLGPQHEPMVRGWGSATHEYLVTAIRNRKKNEPTTN